MPRRKSGAWFEKWKNQIGVAIAHRKGRCLNSQAGNGYQGDAVVLYMTSYGNAGTVRDW